MKMDNFTMSNIKLIAIEFKNHLVSLKQDERMKMINKFLDFIRDLKGKVYYIEYKFENGSVRKDQTIHTGEPSPIAKVTICLGELDSDGIWKLSIKGDALFNNYPYTYYKL